MVKNETVEKSFLAQAAKLIVKKAGYNMCWRAYFNMFMFDYDEILKEVPRFERSKIFGDPDYLENVYKALELAYQKDPQRAIAMIIYILLEDENINIKEEDLIKYPVVKEFLENKDLKDFSRLLPKIIRISPTTYLEISENDIPDPFYKELIRLINKCYVYEIYPAVLIFSRKLLENLLIDILRKKYGMQHLELFYDKKRRRFLSFNDLLKNFEDKLNDFKIIVPNLDKELIRKINEFREAGNSSAHSLELNNEKVKKLVNDKQGDLEYIVKVLIRIYNNIPKEK